MLRKSNRISKESFKELKKPLKVLRGKFLTGRVFPNNEANPRFSLTISKKVAKTAVLRNKIRRFVYDQLRTDMPQGVTIQFVLNKNPDTLNELEQDLHDLLLQNNNIHPPL